MKKRIITYFIFSLSSLLIGCVNAPYTSNYYLIESPELKTEINSAQQIILYPIQLSDYLKSNNLHVKSNAGEIVYSATDLWAEQPTKMLWRAIEQNLEQHTGHHVLTSYEASNSCAKVKIRINELSPNIDGTITSKGRWFINSDNALQKTNTFSFSGDMKNDGYNESNKVIANHLNDLSRELAKQIRQLGLCQ